MDRKARKSAARHQPTAGHEEGRARRPRHEAQRTLAFYALGCTKPAPSSVGRNGARRGTYAPVDR